MSVNTYRINYVSTIVPYRRYNREMKTLANSVNFDKNDAGKFRLKVIKHAENMVGEVLVMLMVFPKVHTIDGKSCCLIQEVSC